MLATVDLSLVFQFLSWSELILRARRVCSSWNQMITKGLTEFRVGAVDVFTNVTPLLFPKASTLGEIFFSTHSLKTLDLSFCTSLEDTILSQLFSSLSSCKYGQQDDARLPNLETLDVSFCNRLENAEVCHPTLKALRMCCCSSLRFLSVRCPSLESIDVSGSVRLKAEYLQNIATFCPKLVHIYACFLVHLTSFRIQIDNFPGSTQLKTLSLQGCRNLDNLTLYIHNTSPQDDDDDDDDESDRDKEENAEDISEGSSSSASGDNNNNNAVHRVCRRLLINVRGCKRLMWKQKTNSTDFISLKIASGTDDESRRSRKQRSKTITTFIANNNNNNNSTSNNNNNSEEGGGGATKQHPPLYQYLHCDMADGSVYWTDLESVASEVGATAQTLPLLSSAFVNKLSALEKYAKLISKLAIPRDAAAAAAKIFLESFRDYDDGAGIDDGGGATDTTTTTSNSNSNNNNNNHRTTIVDYNGVLMVLNSLVDPLRCARRGIIDAILNYPRVNSLFFPATSTSTSTDHHRCTDGTTLLLRTLLRAVLEQSLVLYSPSSSASTRTTSSNNNNNISSGSKDKERANRLMTPEDEENVKQILREIK